jgi:transcriptional regulator of arginine metabolism
MTIHTVMNKHSRHFAIKQIITQRTIASQDELCDALREGGFDITQATLSRDLKELGIARINAPDGPRYKLHMESEENRLRSFISYEILTIESNEAMIVIKTLPGRAQGVAEILDNIPDSGILGTIAGDNTIFIAPDSVKRIPEIIAKLRTIVAS